MSNLSSNNGLIQMNTGPSGFFDSTVSLCGFGKKSGHWREWKMIKTKMHAEFES